ncbi:MAG TPA: hypothetical protein VME23_02805 [Terracidiphilus sp.]|jgi:hypothetical protein|nr:hypothetical protein [Terracidiphilus sp.]
MHLMIMLAQQQQFDPEMVQKILMAFIPIVLIFGLIAIALVMIPCWMILKKAGFTPWLALLCILPSLGTLVLLYVLAFAEWKVVPAPQQQYPGYTPPPTA